MSITIAAIANLTSAITKGCASAKPILVAVDADAHSIANNIPADTHEYCLPTLKDNSLIICAFIC